MSHKTITIVHEENIEAVRYYQKIVNTVRKHGLETKTVTYTQNHRKIQQWTKEIHKKIHSARGTVLSFSLSAYATMLAASRDKETKLRLILCSPSPLYRESVLPKYVQRSLGKKRLQEISKLSYKDLKFTSNCSALILLGDQEVSEMIKINTLIAKNSRNIELKMLEGIRHNLQDEHYINAILQELKTTTA